MMTHGKKWTEVAGKNTFLLKNKLWWYPQQQEHRHPYALCILMPSLTTWAPFCAVVLPMWTVIPVIKTITWLLLARCKATNHTRTLRNLPNPASGTYGTRLRNLHHFTPELSGTLPEPAFRNLHQHTPASGTYTILHRNSPEPSGTGLRNLHQHTPELSVLQNLLLRPARAHTGAYLGWRPH